MHSNSRGKVVERIAEVLTLVRARIPGEQREHLGPVDPGLRRVAGGHRVGPAGAFGQALVQQRLDLLPSHKIVDAGIAHEAYFRSVGGEEIQHDAATGNGILQNKIESFFIVPVEFIQDPSI